MVQIKQLVYFHDIWLFAIKLPKIMNFGDFGVPSQTLETDSFPPDDLAREGILNLGTMLPGYQVPWYITYRHLAVW